MPEVLIKDKSRQVDQTVPETINSALDHLNLDDLEASKVVPYVDANERCEEVNIGVSSDVPRQPQGLMHLPSHHQIMNPFLPYPLMHVSHHNGFFPLGDGRILPVDSSAAGDFNNSMGFNSSQNPGLELVSEPLWSASQDYQFVRGSSFVGDSIVDEKGKPVGNAAGVVVNRNFSADISADISDAPGLDNKDQTPYNELDVSHRRQTFHDIVDSELLNKTPVSSLVKIDTADETVKPLEVKATGFNDTTYPQAAYPYGNALLEHNSVLSVHHPPSGSGPNYSTFSSFPAYGFSSPFSPIPGTSSINSNHQNSGISPNDGNKSFNVMDSGNSWRYHPPGNHSFPGHMVSHLQTMGTSNNNSHYCTNSRLRNNNNGKRNNPDNNTGSKIRNMNHAEKFRGSHHNQYHYSRTNENNCFADGKLENYVGKIYSLCKDQHGCRFLQKKLDIGRSEAATFIFEEIKQYVVELMTDSFGNYLIQKLIERVSKKQRIFLVNSSADQFISIALDPHGTRALQKLVECIVSDEESQIIIKSLKDYIVELSRDLNGNHVVQRCLQKLESKDSQFIFDAACDDCVKIATHRHGCCVLQRCLDHGSKEQRKQLCDKVLHHASLLALDPFGNYVIQYIITKETELGENYEHTNKIVELLKPRVIELSLHKFGSNVVEKILRTPVVAETMILELLNSSGQFGIGQLLHDGYGNYVLQTALDVSKLSNIYLYYRLKDLLKPMFVGSVRNTPHGRKIMNILQIE